MKNFITEYAKYIQMVIDGWASTELREMAQAELTFLISQLSKYEVMHEVDIRTIESLRAQVSQLTKRAPDGATCPRCHSNNAFNAVICVDCGWHTPPRQ